MAEREEILGVLLRIWLRSFDGLFSTGGIHEREPHIGRLSRQAVQETKFC